MTPRRNLRLEAVLAARIRALPCSGCGKPLGTVTAIRISAGPDRRPRYFHVAHAPEVIS